MKRIRYLTVRFDAAIQHIEIPAFRGAIIDKIGTAYTSFHNHLAEGQFLYRYPVIQYKQIGCNPAIVCLEEGTDDIQHFFQQRTWDIRIGERPLTLTVKDLRLHQYTLQAWEHTFRVRIHNWLALNETNYARYQSTSDDLDRLELLEKILTGNILSMAKGLDWRIEREVRVRILRCSPLRWLRFKGQLLAGFDLDFATNVFLPDWIGLGKGVSVGFGVVMRERQDQKRTGGPNPQNHPNEQPETSLSDDDEY
ncbi:CRISPR-associated endonuclease Cas6 [Fibrella arboris]|uniref:CRISPR-associated endonuclease Cas6 n=1 Tax=Fibrella arboris TaxID=3242486 RepID=UPI00352135B4